MTLRRELLVSFGVQGAGAAAVLLATLWLGARFGPEVQGGFSRSKSELEFVVALAMFGLPQALFYFVRSGRMGAASALRWAFGTALVALPIGALFAWARHAPTAAGGAAEAVQAAHALQAPIAQIAPIGHAALVAAAVAACVLHGQLRALLLVGAGTAGFNLATALPQVLVLLGVGLVVGGVVAPGTSTWFGVFGIAGGVTALFAWQRLQSVRALPTDSSNASSATAATTPAAGWQPLLRYGLAAWLTAALATAAVLAMQRWVDAAAGRAALGRFTLALTLVQVPLTPIAYAAPLLLRRWMDRPGARASRRSAALLFGALLVLAGAVWSVAPGWPDLGLGTGYAGATEALAVLLAGGAAEAASRVLSVQAGASGQPWIAVRAELARWGVLGLGWLALGWLVPLPDGLLPLCALWSAAAVAAAAVFVGHGRGAPVGAAAEPA